MVSERQKASERGLESPICDAWMLVRSHQTVSFFFFFFFLNYRCPFFFLFVVLNHFRYIFDYLRPILTIFFEETYEETEENFHQAIDVILAHQDDPTLGPGGAAAEVLVASHNRYSVERTIQKMAELGVSQEGTRKV